MASSPSASVSPSSSPSPSAPGIDTILRIAKPGINVLQTYDPKDLIFSSEYGTLKYFSKQAINLTIDANAGDIACTGSYTHGLTYYPFVEVFVAVGAGGHSSTYEYCPFAGAGASVFYSANVKLTTDKITVYGEIDGFSTSLWYFDFLIFVHKNNLQL